jgi:hypothetical protein
VGVVSARNVRVDELSEFCGALAQDLMKDHEKRFAEIARTVKDNASGLNNAASKFATGVKNAWGSMDKTASEYGMRLAHKIQETSQELSRKEFKQSYKDAEKFHEESVQALNSIILNVRKYLPKLHRGLKTELASLNGALAKLESSVKAMETALDNSPGLKLESLRREAHAVVEKQGELTALNAQMQRESQLLDEASTVEQQLSSERSTVTSGPEFLELKRLEDELSEKEVEIKDLLQPILKPLLKLERAVSMKQVTSVDAKALHDMVERPVESIAMTQSFGIVDVLHSLEEVLERGQLEIDERKRRKATETIQSINAGMLDTIREEYLTLQANIQETTRQLRSKGLIEKKDAIDRSLSETRTKKQAILVEQRNLQRRAEELGKGILKQNSAIESQVQKLAHKSILISVE